jgi:hypothetical protein
MSIVVLMLSPIFLCGATQIDVRPFNLPDFPEIEHKLTALGEHNLRPPQGDLEQKMVAAGKASIGDILRVVPGTFLGTTTFEEDGMDVLVAAWDVDDPGRVRRVWVRDEPAFNWLVLDCDASVFASPASIKTFFQQVHWGDDEHFKVDRLDLAYSYSGGRSVMSGAGSTSPYNHLGVEMEFYAIREPGMVRLTIKGGKQLFSKYPHDMRYVPERFPPLAERVANWDKRKLLSEIGRMLELPGSIAHSTNRDEILIPEVVSRGLADEDLPVLMMPHSSTDEIYWLRTSFAMEAIVKTGQLKGHERALEEVVFKIGSSGTDNDRAALQSIFGVLQNLSKEDFSAMAIRCARRCLNADGAVMYLEARGSTEEAYKAAGSASVSPWWLGGPRAAMEAIRRRIQSGGDTKQ